MFSKGDEFVLKAVFCLAIVGVILGIWKLIELFIWIYNHIRII